MVSQNAENDWENSPSRTGSVLSLDVRQRPPAAKTPPSYYDAVRSRHSLSQPVNKASESGKQEKNLHIQQVKYNSLPRPLPQRYAQSPHESPHVQKPIVVDGYDPVKNTDGSSWPPNHQTPVRQEYDSPPKPANHVPLQVHQDRNFAKRPPGDFSPQGLPTRSRGNDHQRVGNGYRLVENGDLPRQEMNTQRKEMLHKHQARSDTRLPPPIPGRRQQNPQVPIPNGYSAHTLPRRDASRQDHGEYAKNGYHALPNGQPLVPNGAMNGCYEPRYSKSGKLFPRPHNQAFEVRPMPPPAVSLRTGPLGSYPDSQTTRKNGPNSLDSHTDRLHREMSASSDPSVSQQIFVDTESYPNSQTMITDHLAIPYRIPQVSNSNEGVKSNLSPMSNGSRHHHQQHYQNHDYHQKREDPGCLPNGQYDNHHLISYSRNPDAGIYANHQPSSYDPTLSRHHATNGAIYENQHVPDSGPENTKHRTKPPTSREEQHLARSPKHHSLPPPSGMMMVTETRGWNGQANSYSKDVVKPTPRIPRYVNGILAAGPQSATVPAYQWVMKELSNHQNFGSACSSSTLPARSGYDSTSSSVKGFPVRPSTSSSLRTSPEQRKTVEVNDKDFGGVQHMRKNVLSSSRTSLCSEASSISSRRFLLHNDPLIDKMNEEMKKRNSKGSIFSASPWEREEKERLQREQLLGARRARDQEIAFLESIAERTEKQEEWLRILRLEREFQRRAEQELHHSDEEDGSICSESSDSEPETRGNFREDKLTIIPNERLAAKLLDNQDSSVKTWPSLEKLEDKALPAMTRSEKHFVPLELSIPDEENNHALVLSSEQNADDKARRKSSHRRPVPAPRPSKSTIASFTHFLHSSNNDITFTNTSGDHLVGKLDASNTNDCYYKSEDGNVNDEKESQHSDWLIEVNSFHSCEKKCPENGELQKQSLHVATSENLKDDSHIYENIRPMDYQNKTSKSAQNNNIKSNFESHTLPKSTTSISDMALSSKSTNIHPSTKYAAANGNKANDFPSWKRNTLPSMCVSSKTRNGYAKDLPSDLEDKSPEFKKLWISRPEKLTFQDKIRKFSLQAGENDLPRDRVKNSRAQREIENKFSDGQKKLSSSET